LAIVGCGKRLTNCFKLTFDGKNVRIYSGFGENSFLWPEEMIIEEPSFAKGYGGQVRTFARQLCRSADVFELIYTDEIIIVRQ
jgi:hypothetical protein